MARPQLPSLPKPRGVFWLLAAFALALLLEGRRGSAAPLQSHEGAPPMAKIYPRGSHWAVGHFMGKKSAGDFPYMYEEQNKAPFSLLLDDIKRLEEDPRWEETAKKLLRLLEANDSRGTQVFREELSFPAKNTWEAEDNSSFKDMMDYLLQAMERKESSPS
ncbi:PREDICTED: gastrin-releasing peptide [Gekko japonicus]|uniref:Gastrin-releasing peptide n=1 Tax=Gekko japonicus TaxID=146911 RepID=A0ABM1JIP3_GEKJA|nr:PREDICTED: gastrin-releasing peptide [Gekko japonicus]